MRKSLLTAALCFVSLVPYGAYAQSDEDAASEEGNEAPAPEGAATIAPDEGGGEGGKTAPGTQHTVERGDTLWDLSQKYLGSPWYWPKVWSYNPEIANPHWIYPGNQVRFFPTGEEVPTQVEIGAPETPDVDEGMMVADDDRVHVSGQIGFRPKAAISLLTPGFITSAEVEETGHIAGSFGETEHLFYPQKIYVEFAKKGAAKLGETYLVFRNMGEVLHPVTQLPVGVYTRIVGQVRVTAIDNKSGMATVEIVRMQDVVMRGDLIGPAGESMMRNVAARPNERDVKDAILVAAPNRALTHYAENQLAIIDKGSDDGVKPGNTFTIWRQHDSLGQDKLLNPSRIEEQWPREDIGECVAFEVKSKVSICLISRSLRELVRGDHAEMRANGARRASR